MERNECQTCFGDPRVRANPALRRSPSRRLKKKSERKTDVGALHVTLGVKRTKRGWNLNCGIQESIL